MYRLRPTYIAICSPFSLLCKESNWITIFIDFRRFSGEQKLSFSLFRFWWRRRLWTFFLDWFVIKIPFRLRRFFVPKNKSQLFVCVFFSHARKQYIYMTFYLLLIEELSILDNTRPESSRKSFSIHAFDYCVLHAFELSFLSLSFFYYYVMFPCVEKHTC